MRPLFAVAAMMLAGAAPVAVDAPELAAPGRFAAGHRSTTLIDPARHDRRLAVDIWYPARASRRRAITYAGALPTEAGGWAKFTIAGVAVEAAAPAGAGYPLVIVSHGYSNTTANMAWLGENLASKGYVVAAIAHDDPPITDRAQFAGPIANRPADIALVARTLPGTLAGLADPARLALIGYSMGGYGVLTAGGAAIDATGPVGAIAGKAAVPPLSPDAVIAIAPAGGGAMAAWGANGLAGLHAPLLLIAGDADRVVDYGSGAKAVFAAAIAAPRWLLTFKGAGHAIGLGAAPPEMRASLWDLDWFEDPVWRKDRTAAITLHFITAFLDTHVKHAAGTVAYLDVPTADSDSGRWSGAGGYDAISPGGGNSVWKGFRRNHAQGLKLESLPAR